MADSLLRSGVQLLSTFCANGRMLSTGIQELDELIGGGLCTGQVMEVIGSTTSGKTHLCHAMTARVAASHPPALGHRVLYIDCVGQFSIARLLSYVESECRCEKESGDRDEFHVCQTMRRVSVARCVDLNELVDMFQKLYDQIRSSLCKQKRVDSMNSSEALSTSTEKKLVLPELIIIDTLSSAFSLMPMNVVEDSKSSGLLYNHDKKLMEHLIAEFSLLVRHVAYLANLAVVVTNPIPVPQLLFSGSYYTAWAQAPHLRLLLNTSTTLANENIPLLHQSHDKRFFDKPKVLYRSAVLRHCSGCRQNFNSAKNRESIFSTNFCLP